MKLLKKDYLIVYQPICKPRKRFLISVNKLADYLPENRLKQVLSVIAKMKANKQRVGLYENGLVDIYRR